MLSNLTQDLRGSASRWLSRRMTAQGDEVVLEQRRIFILPTRAGLGYALLLVLLFIGSVNYNLSIGLALTFVLAACAMVDLHMTFRNLAYLRLSGGRALPAHAGEEVRFELQLENPGRHARYAVWLSFVGTGLPDRAQAVDIPAEGACRVSLETPAAAAHGVPAGDKSGRDNPVASCSMPAPARAESGYAA